MRGAAAVAVAAVACLSASAEASRHVYRAHSTCYAEHGLMADGTRTRDRSVAMNSLPLGSKIKLVGRRTFFHNRRIFYVRDRIGWGSQLDFWDPSRARCLRWGRRDVRYVVLRRGRR